MNVTIKRNFLSDSVTLGELYIEGKKICLTLEDAVRDKKIPGETAIPYGKYTICIDYSNRFQKLMPHVLDVPNFVGVRIHCGNTPKDTEGCILVGMGSQGPILLDSREAYKLVFDILQSSKEPITLEIVKGQ